MYAFTLLYAEKSSFAFTGAEEATAPNTRWGNCRATRKIKRET